MRVRWGSKLAIVCGLSLFAAPDAGAEPEPDASCPAVGSGNTVVQGTQRVAQTFTAGISGKLTSAQIRVTKNMIDPATGDYQLRLAPLTNGTPTNDVLGTATVPFASVPAGSINLPITGSFNPAPDLTAGTNYALVVTRPPAGANGLRLNSQPPVVGCAGTMFISTSQTDPFTESASGSDLTFTTFVEGSPTVSSVDRAPTVTLGKHPKKKTRRRVAKFKFTADEPGVSFSCRLDRKALRSCVSGVKFRKLKPRKHRFEVIATDSAGNLSPPVVFKWKVLSA